jgi:hypothetical protein
MTLQAQIEGRMILSMPVFILNFKHVFNCTICAPLWPLGDFGQKTYMHVSIPYRSFGGPKVENCTPLKSIIP